MSAEQSSTPRPALRWALAVGALALLAAGAFALGLLPGGAPATAGDCLVLAPCFPGPPHRDFPGMVCGDDGKPTEAYCTPKGGSLVCARAKEGGPCQEAATAVQALRDGAPPQNRTAPRPGTGIKVPLFKKHQAKEATPRPANSSETPQPETPAAD